jgi:hypothetical protein
MSDELKSERITTMMAPAEVKAVDEWRRAQPSLPSRGEAIRNLIELGLRAADRASLAALERRTAEAREKAAAAAAAKAAKAARPKRRPSPPKG